MSKNIEPPPIHAKIVTPEGMAEVPMGHFMQSIWRAIRNLGKSKVTDSTADTVTALKDDFNALLADLRKSGVIA